jgi:hypothetical protein
MSKKDDWLSNDWDDAPECIRDRMQRMSKRRSITLLDVLGAVFVLCVTAISAQLIHKHLLKSDTLQSAELSVPPSVVESAQVPVSEEPISLPSIDLNTQPKGLDECLKPGNVIDESVVRCRYGERQKPMAKPPGQGMVSAEYLNNYKSQKANSVAPQRVSKRVENDSHWVDKWSGGGRYLAHWQVVDNHIDGTSVCSNHKRGSIDYRECRKGAKQFYKEQCKAWEVRWNVDNQDWSKQMQRRYCGAASSFSPVG